MFHNFAFVGGVEMSSLHDIVESIVPWQLQYMKLHNPKTRASFLEISFLVLTYFLSFVFNCVKAVSIHSLLYAYLPPLWWRVDPLVMLCQDNVSFMHGIEKNAEW